MNRTKGKKQFAGGSAIYHVAKEMLFINEGLIFKISSVNEDMNILNSNRIRNITRLKEVVFNKIKYLYNNRIEHYKLNYPHLSDKDFEKLKLKAYNFDKSNSGDNDILNTIQGGTYRLYPRGFRCNKCGDFKIINDKNIRFLQSGNCVNQGCNGRYRQIALIKFCEQCGKLDEIYYESRDKSIKDKNLKLLWESQDSPSTWRFLTGNKEKMDFLQIPCNHKIGSYKISNTPAKKYKPMSITSGGVIKPIVISIVDIPNTNIEHPKQEQIVFGIILNKFEELEKELRNKFSDKTLLEYIDEKISSYKDKNQRESYIELIKEVMPKLSQEDIENKIKEKFKINLINTVIEDLILNIDFEKINNEEIKNFFALKGELNSKNEVIPLSNLIKENKTIYKKNVYDKIKNDYKIKEISYVSKLNLITTCVGTVTGPTFKIDDDNFKPHFSPIWKDNREKKDFEGYIYPYETEGLLVEFDSNKIKNWYEVEEGIKIKEDGAEFLLTLDKSSEAYKKIFTLLHTISHLLIKKTSIYTGIDTNSCSEMIFASTGSILIYSTSTINIGGFGSLFENSILKLFIETNNSINKCIYDPLCIEKKGACFSCLHLPEFVCSYFNQDLDRDSLISKTNRFKNKFWN